MFFLKNNLNKIQIEINRLSITKEEALRLTIILQYCLKCGRSSKNINLNVTKK